MKYSILATINRDRNRYSKHFWQAKQADIIIIIIIIEYLPNILFILLFGQYYFIFLHFREGEGVFIFTLLCFADDSIIIIENLTIRFVGKKLMKNFTGLVKLTCLFYIKF